MTDKMITIEMDYLPIPKEEWIALEGKVQKAHEALLHGHCQGMEFLGWVDYPIHYPKKEFSAIKEEAQRLAKLSEAVIVVGIGGSYLGTRAVYEAVMPYYYRSLSQEERGGPTLYFAGKDLSSSRLSAMLRELRDREVSLIVVSKSGKTLESATIFRILRRWMEERYGEHAAERIVVITDREKGVLKALAEEKGYPQFIVPDDIGGRYSVFSPVGMLPLAVAGIDIDELMLGAKLMREQLASPKTEDNISNYYAAARYLLNRKGKAIELLVAYESKLNYVAEWWKQLFGESEGKEGKGLFPADVTFTTDLHSMGQWIQDGPRTIFETVLRIEEERDDIAIPHDEGQGDGMDLINDKTLGDIKHHAIMGTREAHGEGGVPQILLNVKHLDERHLGALLYFFMRACAISGLLLGVNPFDQPGVEAYKQNLYRRLQGD